MRGYIGLKVSRVKVTHQVPEVQGETEEFWKQVPQERGDPGDSATEWVHRDS